MVPWKRRWIVATALLTLLVGRAQAAQPVGPPLTSPWTAPRFSLEIDEGERGDFRPLPIGNAIGMHAAIGGAAAASVAGSILGGVLVVDDCLVDLLCEFHGQAFSIGVAGAFIGVAAGEFAFAARLHRYYDRGGAKWLAVIHDPTWRAMAHLSSVLIPVGIAGLAWNVPLALLTISIPTRTAPMYHASALTLGGTSIVAGFVFTALAQRRFDATEDALRLPPAPRSSRGLPPVFAPTFSVSEEGITLGVAARW